MTFLKKNSKTKTPEKDKINNNKYRKYRLREVEDKEAQKEQQEFKWK